jgi:ProP effector
MLELVRNNRALAMNQATTGLKIEKMRVLQWLIEHFPLAFSTTPSQVKPLKIGIFDDIIDLYERFDTPPFSKKRLRTTINHYSGSRAYLLSQKPDAARIDLFGQPVDIVTIEQAAYAKTRYQTRYTKTIIPDD